MRFVPYPELGDTPNIVVDGSGTDSTVLTLSHWPGSSVPDALAADLSAEIVVNYLDHPELHVAVDAVSNNHFDEDGLMGVTALVDAELADAHRELLVDVARAGDFGWSRTREAARIAFTISTFVDAERSSLGQATFEGDYAEVCGRLYSEMLPRVPDLLDHVDRFRDMWADEDDHLGRSDDAFARGDVTITEHPDLDLAVVRMPEMDAHLIHRFTQPRRAGLHPMAVHNRTTMTRVAYLRAHTYEVELRYETWVQFVSRRVLPRPDLAPLADRLNEREASGGKWEFDGASGLTPQLHLREADESTLAPDDFVDALLAYLPDALPAWDPWAPR